MNKPFLNRFVKVNDPEAATAEYCGQIVLECQRDLVVGQPINWDRFVLIPPFILVATNWGQKYVPNPAFETAEYEEGETKPTLRKQ